VRLPKKDVRLYKVDGTQCFGQFIGSGATFRDIFHYALEQSHVSLIHFDNIDQLQDRSVSILKSELSSVPRGKMLVFATASRKELLHEGLKSRDEFDFTYEIQLPLFWERVATLKIHFNKRGCSIGPEDLTSLAKLTTGYTGAELEKLVSMVNITIVEQYNSAYFDIIKSLAKPFDISGFNVNLKEREDPIVTDDDGSEEAIELKKVTKEQLKTAFQDYEKIRMKKKPFPSGNKNINSATSSGTKC